MRAASPRASRGLILVASCVAFGMVVRLGGAEPRVLDDRLELVLVAKEPEVVTPVGLDVDTRGRIWVIESNTHFPKDDYDRWPSDRILIIDESASGDSRLRVFADGLHQTMGLRLVDDRHALIATRREVFVYRDDDGDGRSDGRRSLARLDTTGDYPHNGLSGFAIDALGDVWFGMGENLGVAYRLCGADGAVVEGGGEGGNVFRIGLDGAGLTWWATGFWNPFHLDFDHLGRLFVVDNDPDSRPPCRLLQVVRGGDYGYRFRLGRKGLHPFTSWNGALPGTLPMASGTGEAPSGIVAYEHDALPADYLGSLLVTSWGDHRIEAYDTVLEGGSGSATLGARQRVVARGGDDFRPVGIAIAPDGSVVFSDWVDASYNVHGKGRIWRLRPKGGAARESGSRSGTGDLTVESAAKLLASPVRTVREEAVHRLERQEGSEDIARALLRQSSSDRARMAALTSLARTGRLDIGVVHELLEEQATPVILAAAIRLLGRVDAAAGRTSIAELLRSERVLPPAARVEALLALEDLDRLLIPVVADAAGLGASNDPFVRSAALDALARLLRPRDAVALTTGADAQARLVGLLVLRRMGGVGRLVTPLVTERRTVGVEVVRRLLADPDVRVRQEAMRWAGEEGLAELRAELDDAFEAGPLSAELLDFWLAARGLLAGEDPSRRDQEGRDRFLYEIALRGGGSPVLRAGLLRSISSSWDGWRLEDLTGLLATDDAVLRVEAVRSLGEARPGGAREPLERLASDPGADIEARAWAVVGLGTDPQVSRDVLASLLGSDVDVVRREAARALRGVELDPESETRRRALDGRLLDAGASEDPETREALQRGGDPARGERLFHHPRGPGCARCHTVRGRGGRSGPDLSTAGRMDRGRLIDSILTPSKEVAPQFSTWTVVTTGGVLTGVLLGEGADGTLRIGNAQGEEVSIDPATVLEKRLEPTSLMPADLSVTMTLEELRDVLAWLETLRQGD